MNEIEKLETEVREIFPEARTRVDLSEAAKGFWFLNIIIERDILVVEWNPERGFGIYSWAKHVYGEEPEHVSQAIDEVIEQLLALLAVRAYRA